MRSPLTHMLFYGMGLAFPFRIASATGGTVVTAGIMDSVSVSLQYLMERWSIREDTDENPNHIAEAIAHILLTRPTEHDTLPEFGSYLFNIIFEPNSMEFRLAATHYFASATERWEKRAYIQPNDVEWVFRGPTADRGELPLLARITFIMEQVPGNLVAPFVTVRQARLQEYSSPDIDTNTHDRRSRYYGLRGYSIDGVDFIRLKKPVYYPPQADDEYHRVQEGESWLLIAWKKFGDIRAWPIIAQMYSQDNVDGGRGYMDTTGDPPAGSLIRIPSRTRMLMDLI